MQRITLDTLPAAYRLPPTAYCLLPTAYRLLPTVYFLTCFFTNAPTTCSRSGVPISSSW
jgi:hypothetical protein